MYQYLIFDLDDTLNNDDENRKYAFSKILEYLKQDVTKEKIEEFLKLDTKYWHERAQKGITEKKAAPTKEEIECIRAQRFVIYFRDMSLDEAIKINRMYLQELKENVVEIEGAFEIIKYLSEKGYKIAVATNGPTAAIKSKLQKLKIDTYIECAFSADEVRIYET